MKHEVYELRKTPQLKITLNKVDLHVIDVFDPINSGTYFWNDIKSIELNKEKIKWIFSIFNGLIDLFAGTAASKVYKFKSNLKIVLDGSSIIIKLHKVDLERMEDMLTSMEAKLTI
ncbi:hypothetical protein [Nonlabens sp. Asnod3-A02]|uniref:hypothetical protein n=1 Tax=Nonlabens sp. Asnod3-A02 TaxID=3160579 RepID=UPI003862EAD7